MTRPSWVEIDLDAIRHNVASIAAACAPAAYCAVVKADGYGHGDVPVAEAAVQGGANWLAVALVEEGVRLREAGIEVPILLLSEPPPEAAGEILTWKLTPTVYGTDLVRALEAVCESRMAVHLKIDTGMHRVGTAGEEALDLARRIAGSSRLELEGLWTHLAVAEEDSEFTRRQLQDFDSFLHQVMREGIRVPLVHAANTAAALKFPEGRYDLVRVGLGTYGLRPAPHVAVDLDLRPALRVLSRVSLVRRLPAGSRPSYGRRRPLPSEGWVATAPIGYADGYPRRMSDCGGNVLIGGHRWPLAGTVTMDQIVVDVGDHPVHVGDEVVLLGRQGEAEIPAEEWAGRLGTINYEVVCQIGPRLPRRYHSSSGGAYPRDPPQRGERGRTPASGIRFSAPPTRTTEEGDRAR